MSSERRLHRPAGSERARMAGARAVPRRATANDAAVERVVQRLGPLSEFTDSQIRQIAAIALVAVAVDDTDRQRRDETARENRGRLHSLGRD